MLWVRASIVGIDLRSSHLTLCAGKVGMSVLTKGLAMDFVRQGRKEMAITSIWPAAVCSQECREPTVLY